MTTRQKLLAAMLPGLLGLAAAPAAVAPAAVTPTVAAPATAPASAGAGAAPGERAASAPAEPLEPAAAVPPALVHLAFAALSADAAGMVGGGAGAVAGGATGTVAGDVAGAPTGGAAGALTGGAAGAAWGAAVAELRRAGPAAVPALLEAQAEHPAAASRFRDTLDAVCAQHDCAASRLFWFTDLEQAKAEARRSGRPILSLRLLGRLDEEMSCANSRFFRTVLYANEEVSRLLRERFVLHWSSERPVPKVTIDFGDGRALRGTLTGNSVHYVLDARGRLVDALPGLYGPLAFRRLLELDRQEALDLSAYDDALFAFFLGNFHAEQRQHVLVALDRDLGLAGGSRPARPARPAAGERRLPASNTTPTVYQAAPLAMTKSAGEGAALAALSIAARQQAVAAVDWEKVAALHAADWQLDARCLAALDRRLERRQAAGDGDPVRRSAAVRRFAQLVGVDTMRNEALYHVVLHAWLATEDSPADLDRFNRRVYADLFLTPRSDPWLGLASPETFMALEPAAIP